MNYWYNSGFSPLSLNGQSIMQIRSVTNAQAHRRPRFVLRGWVPGGYVRVPDPQQRRKQSATKMASPDPEMADVSEMSPDMEDVCYSEVEIPVTEVEIESIPMENIETIPAENIVTIPVDNIENVATVETVETIEGQPMIALQPLSDDQDEIVLQTREEVVGDVDDFGGSTYIIDSVPVPTNDLEDHFGSTTKRKKGRKTSRTRVLASGESVSYDGERGSRKWEQKQVQIQTLEGKFSVTMWASGKKYN